MLENGIQNLFVLGEDEGLILRANEEFVQTDKVRFPLLLGTAYHIMSFFIRNGLGKSCCMV